MLRTLLAQEARTMGRTHLVVLGVAALVATVLVLVGLLDLPGVSVTSRALVVVVLVAPVPGISVHCLVEYWQSMYGRRGYLTMTIPVRGRVVYAAKVVYAVLATTAAAVLAAAAYTLAYAVDAWRQGVTLSDALAPVRGILDPLGTGMTLLLALVLVLMVVSWVLMSTALMSIGAQGRWNHLGFGAPVLGFVILYLVSQVVDFLTMLLVPLSISVPTGNLVLEMPLVPFLEAMSTGADPQVVGVGFLPATWIMAAAMGWWAVRAIEDHTSLR